MRILTVVGARPQLIKASVVSLAIAKVGGIHETLLHTGQHFDSNMSDVFFRDLGVPKPAIMLNVSGGGHGAMTGRMLAGVEAALQTEKPDMVMVYGDTNSTLAGALAAVKLHIPVAHVEAGLRSFDRRMPEEINRILTDHVSSELFCPTINAVNNLEVEGMNRLGHPARVHLVGDVMLDATRHFARAARQPEASLPSGSFVLATLHRAENTDDEQRLQRLVEGLNSLHDIYPVVWPLHPRTRLAIEHLGLELRMNVLPPVGYLEMLWLLSRCGLVVTDSGGLQKEAFFMGRQCLTCRDTTEWVELVERGANTLVGTDVALLVSKAREKYAEPVAPDAALYGDGKASEKIATILAAK